MAQITADYLEDEILSFHLSMDHDSLCGDEIRTPECIAK